ncbi:unnamed protein product [Trichobilharzia regenti]|nr:unnamed protein product [Trichobilharzia regenti]
MAYKENEQKLIKEVALRESLENQLVKSSAEIEQLKNNYEVLSKQAKLEKSSRFTDLVAELDRKWSETVGRECARVRGETCMKLELDYKVKLEEIRRRYDQSLSDNNNQWEIKFQKKQLELDELIQNKNDNNQEISRFVFT